MKDNEPKPDGREIKGEATRKLVVQSAIRCIVELGLSKASIAKIAERAGVSQTLVMFHFKTKVNLFSQVLNELGAPFREEWNRIVGDTSLNAAQKTWALTEFEVRHAARNPECIAVWFAFWGPSDGASIYSDVAGPFDKTASDTMKHLIVKACPNNDPELSTTLHSVLSALLWGYMIQCHVESDAPPPDEFLKSVRYFLSPHLDV